MSTVRAGWKLEVLPASRGCFYNALVWRDRRDSLDPSPEVVLFLSLLCLFGELRWCRIGPRALIRIGDFFGLRRGGGSRRLVAPNTGSLTHNSVVRVDTWSEDTSGAGIAGGGRLRRDGRDVRRVVTTCWARWVTSPAGLPSANVSVTPHNSRHRPRYFDEKPHDLGWVTITLGQVPSRQPRPLPRGLESDDTHL